MFRKAVLRNFVQLPGKHTLWTHLFCKFASLLEKELHDRHFLVNTTQFLREVFCIENFRAITSAYCYSLSAFTHCTKKCSMERKYVGLDGKYVRLDFVIYLFGKLFDFIIKYTIFGLKCVERNYYILFRKQRHIHCMKIVQIRSFFWSTFSRIRNNSVRMWENADQKNSAFGHFSRSDSPCQKPMIELFTIHCIKNEVFH